MYSGFYSRAPAENGVHNDRDSEGSNQRVKTALTKLEEKIMQSEQSDSDGRSPRDLNRPPSRTSLPSSNLQKGERSRRSVPGGGATRQSDSEEGDQPSRGDVDLWESLIAEATPSQVRGGLFNYRDETYRFPKQGKDGKVYVWKENTGVAIYAGHLTGPLANADKRLRASLNRKAFLSPTSKQGKGIGQPGVDGRLDLDDQWSQILAQHGMPPEQGEVHHVSRGSDVQERWDELVRQQHHDTRVGGSSFAGSIIERTSIVASPQPGGSRSPPPSAEIQRPQVRTHLEQPVARPSKTTSVRSPSPATSSRGGKPTATASEPGSRRGSKALEGAQSSDVLFMLVGFVTAQGVDLKAGDPVVCVRPGQRGWLLVRDSSGTKSWVPQSYVQPLFKPDDDTTTVTSAEELPSTREQTREHTREQTREQSREQSRELTREPRVISPPVVSPVPAASVRQSPSRSPSPAPRSQNSSAATPAASWLVEGRKQQTSVLASPSPRVVTREDVERSRSPPPSTVVHRGESSGREEGRSLLDLRLRQQEEELAALRRTAEDNELAVDVERKGKEQLLQRVRELENIANSNLVNTLQQEIQEERVERERERLVWEERLASLERYTAQGSRNGSPSHAPKLSSSPPPRLSTAGQGSPNSSLLLQLQEEKERVTKLETRIMAVTGGRGGKEVATEGKNSSENSSENSSSLVNELLRQRDELHNNLTDAQVALERAEKQHATQMQSLKDSFKTRNFSLEKSLGGLLDQKVETEEHLGKEVEVLKRSVQVLRHAATAAQQDVDKVLSEELTLRTAVASSLNGTLEPLRALARALPSGPTPPPDLDHEDLPLSLQRYCSFLRDLCQTARREVGSGGGGGGRGSGMTDGEMRGLREEVRDLQERLQRAEEERRREQQRGDQSLIHRLQPPSPSGSPPPRPRSNTPSSPRSQSMRKEGNGSVVGLRLEGLPLLGEQTATGSSMGSARGEGKNVWGAVTDAPPWWDDSGRGDAEESREERRDKAKTTRQSGDSLDRLVLAEALDGLKGGRSSQPEVLGGSRSSVRERNSRASPLSSLVGMDV